MPRVGDLVFDGRGDEPGVIDRDDRLIDEFDRRGHRREGSGNYKDLAVGNSGERVD